MLKNFLKYILFSMFSFFMFFVLIFIIMAVSMGPKVKDNSVLVLELAGPILEEDYQTLTEKLLVGEILTTRGIVNSLQKAKSDSRIKALMVTARGAEMGSGKAQEIRRAIQDFIASKKPVYGYIEDGDTLDYYLCAAAPRLFMPPAGEGGITLVGLRAEVPFFKDTLDKIGVEAQIDHAGKYKGTGETFTRNEMSEDSREAINAVLDSLYVNITNDLAKDRKMDAETIRNLIDEGPHIRSEAKAKKLVDDLLYEDQLADLIKKDTGLKRFEKISMLEYQKPSFTETFNVKPDKIGIVYASGSIVTGESAKGYGQLIMGSSTLMGALAEAREDDSVKAIVLRVDSPGGSAVASDLIWREVEITKKKKPVIVSMADVAASGGYYISMGASKIFADPSTITGSIGVVFGKFYTKGLYDKLGISKDIIKRGENADIYSDYVPFSEEDWELMHKHMASIYDSFTRKAAEGRKMTQAQIDEVAQGRIWTGEQAKKLGLIDQLGGLREAIEEAKKMAKLTGKEISFTIYPQRRGGLSDIISSETPLPQQIKDALFWHDLTRKENLLLLMPYFFFIQ